MMGARTWLLVVAVQVLVVEGRCPRPCRCNYEEHGRKVVTCDAGSLTGPIPVFDMDMDTKILTITSPEDQPNTLTLGPIFSTLSQLEEIHITRSNVPAIGENSLWGLSHLQVLNLTNNNITLLYDSHLKGMRSLEALHLDDNHITILASGTFRSLESLESLTLARNKLRVIAPRVFLLLSRLRYLDLSGNAIQELDPEDLKDIPALRTLLCAECGLTRVKSLVYRMLPLLETLDLRDNRITSLAPEEYMDLDYLKRLYLDGNRIFELKDYTFKGVALQHLGLARNKMERISRMAFEDCSVLSIDLSSNSKLQYSSFRHLSPVIAHMHGLNIANTRISPDHVRELLKRASRLKKLNLSRLHLNQLLPNMFISQAKLEELNLSSNSLRYVPVDILHSLPSLQSLDLRKNEFRGLPEIILRRLDRIYDVELDTNPWSCDQCHIPYLKIWLNNSKSFRTACYPDVDAPKCLKCQSPMEMYDKPIIEIEGLELQPCPEGTFDLAAASASSSNFSLVLAVVTAAVVIILLLIILVTGIIMYNRHTAFYYTHENDSRHHFYENPALHSDHTDITLDEDLDHLPEKDPRLDGQTNATRDAPDTEKPDNPSSGGKKKQTVDNNVVVIDELIRNKNAKSTQNGKS
ncbi:insulin-like growth factor-binding protein complex acid labile subunit [Homarus americanus]|uniref:Insulin-like growth factor-binding protein complex acid labile subunit-like 3 n=1 Tax=Homarus americanus TaxID=6706 RepID=A0A8J5N4D1_HOMAM|nr:insulin-like growth factor-binding protein complex acid labile subunit [Homarus americanus]KAG7173081.1 Insulin-like growth factor-binding protein complex acid labile subunit-like 3 [Homarus americanus]